MKYWRRWKALVVTLSVVLILDVGILSVGAFFVWKMNNKDKVGIKGIEWEETYEKNNIAVMTREAVYDRDILPPTLRSSAFTLPEYDYVGWIHGAGKDAYVDKKTKEFSQLIWDRGERWEKDTKYKYLRFYWVKYRLSIFAERVAWIQVLDYNVLGPNYSEKYMYYLTPQILSVYAPAHAPKSRLVTTLRKNPSIKDTAGIFSEPKLNLCHGNDKDTIIHIYGLGKNQRYFQVYTYAGIFNPDIPIPHSGLSVYKRGFWTLNKEPVDILDPVWRGKQISKGKHFTSLHIDEELFHLNSNFFDEEKLDKHMDKIKGLHNIFGNKIIIEKEYDEVEVPDSENPGKMKKEKKVIGQRALQIINNLSKNPAVSGINNPGPIVAFDSVFTIQRAEEKKPVEENKRTISSTLPYKK